MLNINNENFNNLSKPEKIIEINKEVKKSLNNLNSSLAIFVLLSGLLIYFVYQKDSIISNLFNTLGLDHSQISLFLAIFLIFSATICSLFLFIAYCDFRIWLCWRDLIDYYKNIEK